jgi:glycosyltransferase involved in cell wall biosynthesis
LDAPLLAEIKEATLDQDITVLKSVPDETLRALYSVARAFIFPSLAEGFGWPILEAQACGCPVVTTDREPMRQTAGEAAIYADPETWTEAAINVLEMDQTQRSALVAAGRANAKQHSVKRMVGSYIEFYRSHAR